MYQPSMYWKIATLASLTYNNAISLAHPKAIQVNDRFHLLKNLTAYCKAYLTKFLKPQGVIDKDIDTSRGSPSIRVTRGKVEIFIKF